MLTRLRNRAILLIFATCLSASPMLAKTDYYTKSKPGFQFEFPKDHGAHPDFKTEWWYYNGHLSAEGREFGFELTFFREGMPSNAKKPEQKPSKNPVAKQPGEKNPSSAQAKLPEKNPSSSQAKQLAEKDPSSSPAKQQSVENDPSPSQAKQLIEKDPSSSQAKQPAENDPSSSQAMQPAEKKPNPATQHGHSQMVHLGISDKDNNQFRFFQKFHTVGNKGAGFKTEKGVVHVWEDDWDLKIDEKNHRLVAEAPMYGINLQLVPLKPPAIHGERGMIKKADGESDDESDGRGSHYYTLTRMKTTGTVTWDGKVYKINGESWMDHEFGTDQMGGGQKGWDWWGIQLSDNTELMLYGIRKEDGTADSNASGTYINKDGTTEHLTSDEFRVNVLEQYKSKISGGEYPSGWRVTVPKKGLDLLIKPSCQSSELVTTGIIYFEGPGTVTTWPRPGVPDGMDIGLTKTPERSSSLLLDGLNALAKKRPLLALNSFEKAALQSPASPLPHYYRAMTLYRLGRTSDAALEYLVLEMLPGAGPLAANSRRYLEILATKDPGAKKWLQESIKFAEEQEKKVEN
ncbi:MAG: hypothetical protein K2Z81_28810, partial [Cyanobacteria bacterium]|nr:hypothetical protein [Cyanobacteriota bacterium]